MSDPSPRVGALRRLLPLVLILLVAVVGVVALGEYLNFETLRENRKVLLAFRDAHYLTAALVFMLAYVLIVAFSLPGTLPASLTGGFLFGLFPGALMNVISATIGAVLIFLAVRAGLGHRVTSKIDASEGHLKRLTEGIRDNEFSVIFSLRLMPILPFWLVNVVPALIGVRLRVFALATLVGIIPGGIVYTWVGVGLAEVFARDETPNLGIIFEPHILGPLLGLAALAMLPVLHRAWRDWRDAPRA